MGERRPAGLCRGLAALAAMAWLATAVPVALAAPGSPAAAAVAATAAATGAAAQAARGTETRLACQVVYQPTGQRWVRRVDIAHDDQRVTAVRIDGVAVYSFGIAGTLILTALDNERIQIDTAAQSWRSDFRGAASAQGWCERVPG